jgi:tRNA 2-thiocytidine biosynthesis protein TtcA
MSTCDIIEVKTPKRPLDEIERSLDKTYKKDIFRPFVKAIQAYQLIEPNDKICVGISGGKDSLILAKLFQALKKHQQIPFDVVFLTMNPGFSPVNLELLKTNCDYLNIPVNIENSQIFHVVEKIAQENPCYMCARMRRGFLYEKAKALGCNKLALAHHFDDVIETTLLNMFYGSSFKTMVPKLDSDNFEGITLIRPLVYVKERDIIRWIQYAGIQSMNCGCTVTAKKTSSKRREIKELLERLRKIHPDIDQSIFTAATNVNLDQIYGYYKGDQKVDYQQIYIERKKTHDT